LSAVTAELTLSIMSCLTGTDQRYLYPYCSLSGLPTGG